MTLSDLSVRRPVFAAVLAILMTLVGGREIHPVNVRVGGFYKVPRKRDFAEIAEQLKRARDLALETVRWVAGWPIPTCFAHLLSNTA